MVDIGLGPTDGFSIQFNLVRSWSPRRVQTDAYHHPCVLNYVSCAFTSFFYNSRQAVSQFYQPLFPSVKAVLQLVAGKMRLVFMGTPQFVVPVLDSLAISPEVEVVGVYTTPDLPRGRGRAPEMTPVKARASALGLDVFQPPTLRAASAQEELAGLRPDVLVVAAYGRLLPPPVLDLPLHGCLNLHPSLLPRHRGPRRWWRQFWREMPRPASP